MTEKIKVIMNRRGVTISQLAERTGQSRQNISNKMNRDNFDQRELEKIAAALDCTVAITMTMNDTGETV
jgi:transcriptional regulator with XRE-family HTH domain